MALEDIAALFGVGRSFAVQDLYWRLHFDLSRES